MGIIDIFSRNKQVLKGTEEVSMIVDMQELFLPNPKHYLSRKDYIEEYISARKKLIENIINSIQENMDLGNDIILVEYISKHKTLTNIRKKLGKYSYVLLEKNEDGLLNSANSLRNRALKILKPTIDSTIKLSGIHLSRCVKETAASLESFKFKPRVKINETLNVDGIFANSREKFIERNDLDFVNKSYTYDLYGPKKLTHLLDFGNQNNNLPWFLN